MAESMENQLRKSGDIVYRILGENGSGVLVLNCRKKGMPYYISLSDSAAMNPADESDLPPLRSSADLSPKDREIALKRYTMIAAAVSTAAIPQQRNAMIADASQRYHVSKQTLRSYLWSYLMYQDVAALAPKQYDTGSELTADQQNMRWALNRFFYTRNKNSLRTAYTMMLKEKYCDPAGALFSAYPSFNQFRYFYRKTRKLENYYITRDGLTDYQRNNRPLVGDGVQEYAPQIGTAMLDSTICDIYLVDESDRVVGRPILVIATDANTSLCMGYSLLWEGGTYSLRELMLNILADKTELCRRKGIVIRKEQWNVSQLPGRMITDGGAEYVGQTFEQISEFGVILEKLPPYRAELKGTVEKLFDLIQSSYKTVLKGKGVIMPDFQERGAHDYRKDACLTLGDFEKIVVKCILFHNNHRIIENYPYTEKMLSAGVKPYASVLWNWMMKNRNSNLIQVTKKELLLVLLPRTTGKFSRFGLKVNKLRYYAEGYKEQFLQGGDCVVAYNPENCNQVWVKEKDGRFVEFALIETRYSEKSLDEVSDLMDRQKQIVQNEMEENLRARIELMNFIETIAEQKQPTEAVNLRQIRSARSSARKKNHRNSGGILNEK